MRRARILALVVVLVMIGGGCSGRPRQDSNLDGGSETLAEGELTTDTTSATTTTTTTGAMTGATSTGEVETSAETDEGTTSDGLCLVDWPCFDHFERCDRATGDRWLLRDVPCEEVCGDIPCLGSQCEWVRSQPCEADTTCVQVQYEGDLEAFPNTRCEAQANLCGGPEGLACPDGQFCETIYSECACTTGPGTCAEDAFLGRCVDPSSSDCQLHGPAEVGCDGITYASPCERRAAGVDAQWRK